MEIPMVSRTKVPSENKRKNVQTEKLSIRFTYARCNRFRLAWIIHARPERAVRSSQSACPG